MTWLDFSVRWAARGIARPVLAMWVEDNHVPAWFIWAVRKRLSGILRRQNDAMIEKSPAKHPAEVIL